MSDKPILFSAPMVRALLEGRKTQTRRTIKPQPCIQPEYHEPPSGAPYWAVFNGDVVAGKICIPIAVGDRLWVKEGWRTEQCYDAFAPSYLSGEEPVKYEADRHHQTWGFPAMIRVGKVRQSIFMPRWASRIMLTVTDVRVERLQDISEADAQAEGVFVPEAQYAQQGSVAPKLAYAALWNEINGPDAWEANPFVAAYTFTVDMRNIDQVTA